MIQDFYNDAAGREIKTGMVVAYQTFGDFLRFNSHFHAIILEGGFDEDGTFFYLPYQNLERMTEYFRREVIDYFLKNEMVNEDFAKNLLSWKNSGFSIDNSVRCFDAKSQESIAEYISRPPISLKKIVYDELHGRVLWKTSYNDYFKENLRISKAEDFIAELVQHIPPKRIQLIRRYGLYSYRGKGVWSDFD